MSKKDLEEADLPEGDNPSQNSQIANAVRNQGAVDPEEYPRDKKKAGKRSTNSSDHR
jgi:hypothetical protein